MSPGRLGGGPRPGFDASLDEPSTGRAVGAALGLLGTFIGALAFAFVLSRLVGGTYVTFAMPVFVGTLMAALASYGPRRFGFGARRPLVLMMVGGSLICWLGQHLLAYLRVLDLVAAQQGLSGANATEAALSLLEGLTDQTGFLAYLTFVSSGVGVALSPLGMIARTEPGVVGTILLALVELGLMGLAASWSILYRTRAARRPPAGPLATIAGAVVGEVIAAMQARRFDELPAIVVRSRGFPTHALLLEEGDATAELTLTELDALGRPSTRTSSRLMSIEAAGALRSALAAANATRHPSEHHEDGGGDVSAIP